jgi:hypothetical protein
MLHAKKVQELLAKVIPFHHESNRDNSKDDSRDDSESNSDSDDNTYGYFGTWPFREVNQLL